MQRSSQGIYYRYYMMKEFRDAFLLLKSYLWKIYAICMGLDTIKRFDRIVAILIQLQSRRIVRAQDLADRFDVSLRTIYRDIRTLEASGVPIASEAGVGYSIMEGYRLPPVMFTKEEAGSFVAAEKLMQKFTDRTLGAYHESAMFKVKSLLRGSEKDWISALESQVIITPGEVLFNKEIPNALQILFESIATQKQVFLKYRSPESARSSERHIETVGLFNENHYWYVLAFCHIRQGYRQFRTDRIQDIRSTDKDFLLQHGPLEDHLLKKETVAKTRVRIAVDKEIARYMRTGNFYFGFVSEEVQKDTIVMTFMTADLYQGFARWYLMFADYATILEPPDLKVRVRELLDQASRRL